MKAVRKIWFGERLYDDSQSEFLAELHSMGDIFGFVPVTLSEKPTEVCLFNIPITEVIRLFLSSTLRKLPRFAIVTEPSIVLPHLSWRFWKTVFPHIFWLGRSFSSEVTYMKPHSYLHELDFPRVGDRVDATAFINGNKVSMVKGELYTLRRQLIYGLNNLDVYGSGWTDPKGKRIIVAIKQGIIALASPGKMRFGARRLFVTPEKYMGQVPDKHDTLRKYRVVLAIENSQEILTEKLMDAWMAGCIPVYVGPPLSDFKIPDGLAIECGANFEEVNEGIHKALKLDHAAFLSELKDWLFEESTVFLWSWEPAWKRIFEVDISVAKRKPAS